MNKRFPLTVQDHSVSKEFFELQYNSELDMLITTPKPSENKLPDYYESEDYISHTDHKRSLFEKAYHLVRSNALKKKLRLINSFTNEPGKLLDIGAGTGDFLSIAQNNGWKATGIEPSAKAKTIAKSKNVSFVEGTKDLEDGTFDVITMWHVLEHIPEVANQISELKKLLKPSGTIIIAVPNFNSFDATYYGEFWAAYDVPRHLSHFSKTAIQKLFEKQGLTLTKVLPMKYDAFYVSLLSEKYKNGKMNFIKAFYIGLKSNLMAQFSGEFSSHIYIIKNQ